MTAAGAPARRLPPQRGARAHRCRHDQLQQEEQHQHQRRAATRRLTNTRGLKRPRKAAIDGGGGERTPVAAADRAPTAPRGPRLPAAHHDQRSDPKLGRPRPGRPCAARAAARDTTRSRAAAAAPPAPRSTKTSARSAAQTAMHLKTKSTSARTNAAQSSTAAASTPGPASKKAKRTQASRRGPPRAGRRGAARLATAADRSPAAASTPGPGTKTKQQPAPHAEHARKTGSIRNRAAAERRPARRTKSTRIRDRRAQQDGRREHAQLPQARGRAGHRTHLPPPNRAGSD